MAASALVSYRPQPRTTATSLQSLATWQLALPMRVATPASPIEPSRQLIGLQFRGACGLGAGCLQIDRAGKQDVVLQMDVLVQIRFELLEAGK